MKKKDNDTVIMLGVVGVGAYLLYHAFTSKAQSGSPLDLWNKATGTHVQGAVVPANANAPANPNEVPLATVNTNFPWTNTSKETPATMVSDSDAARLLYQNMLATGVPQQQALASARAVYRQFDPENV